MPARPDTADYRALFLADVPMVDVRAPVEFAKGAFPSAVNLPLMTDDERAQVGTCYKREGGDAAIALGHQLVSGQNKRVRVESWADFSQRHPQGYVYCFRGGLRSQTVKQWLHEAGVHYPLVMGGYKAMRRFLIDELERSLAHAEIVLISGKTGTGKTRAIDRLPHSVDLEGLAHHRGSTFGQLPEPQPAQIDFENALSIGLMKVLAGGTKRVFLEDEGRLIGRLHLPEVLRERMADAPMVVIEQTLDERVDVVVEDYVVDLGQRFQHAYGAAGAQMHAEKLQADLLRIRKRLGGDRFQWVSDVMRRAFEQPSAGLAGHREWVAFLLEKYYDPMYEYQLQQRQGRVLYRGSREAVMDWAAD